MDKIAEALGPWPILQLFFGTAVLGVGVFAVIRGLAGSQRSDRANVEDAREVWEAYRRLEAIERNTRLIAENQKLMLDRVVQATDQIKALISAIWNRGV